MLYFCVFNVICISGRRCKISVKIAFCSVPLHAVVRHVQLSKLKHYIYFTVSAMYLSARSMKIAPPTQQKTTASANKQHH
jgi:hypothetical protein